MLSRREKIIGYFGYLVTDSRKNFILKGFLMVSQFGYS